MFATGPLVLWATDLNILTQIPDMDRTVLRMNSLIFNRAWTISSSFEAKDETFTSKELAYVKSLSRNYISYFLV